LSTDTSYELSSTWIDDATWNADASRIIGFFDTSRYTWDAQTLPPQFLSRDQRDVPIYAIAWSADRSQVATEVLGNVILRDPSSLAWEAMVDNGGNGTIAWSPDGQWLAASDWLSGIYIWNVSSGEFQQKRVIQPPLFETLDPPLTDILALQFSQGGAELDSVGGDGTFTRWNVDTGAVIAALHLPGVPLYSAEFSPDGTQLAYGGEGGTLEIIHMPPPPATPDRGRGSANFVALPALNLYSLRITGTGERSFMVSAGHNLRTDLAYCMLWKSVRNTGYTSH
jgi:WD40 repeat protein